MAEFASGTPTLTKRFWKWLETPRGRVFAASSAAAATYHLWDVFAPSGYGAPVSPLGTDAINVAVESLTSGRDVPTWADIGRSSVVKEIARFPCRSPALAGKAEVVVRYADSTPADVAARMEARNRKHAEELELLKAEEEKRAAKAANGDSGDSVDGVSGSYHATREIELKRQRAALASGSGGVGQFSWVQLGREQRQRERVKFAELRKVVAAKHEEINRDEKADRLKAASVAAAMNSYKGESVLSDEKLRKTLVVHDPSNPVVTTVAGKASAIQEVKDGVITVCKLFDPREWAVWYASGATARASKAKMATDMSLGSGWLRTNTAGEKEHSYKKWLEENAAIKEGRAIDPAAATTKKVADAAALRYAVTSIEMLSSSTGATETVDEALTMGLSKCLGVGAKGAASGNSGAAAAAVTAGSGSDNAVKSSEVDAMAFPTAVGRMLASSMGLLPFPVPSHCRMAVLGFESPALPLFLEESFYRNIRELNVADAEPALLDAAAAHAGLRAVSAGTVSADRFKLHACGAEEFLLRSTEKVDVLMVNLAAGGEAAASRLQDVEAKRAAEAASGSGGLRATLPTWLGGDATRTVSRGDDRCSAHFAKICKKSLSSNGILALALDDTLERADDAEFMIAQVKRMFGHDNVFEMSTADASSRPVRIVVAAQELPTNGMAGRHLAARCRRLGEDYRWPFDGASLLPPSFLLW